MTDPADTLPPDSNSDKDRQTGRRSLWEVIRHGHETPAGDSPTGADTEPEGDPPGTHPADQETAVDGRQDSVADSARPRSLWSVMDSSAQPETAAEELSTGNEDDSFGEPDTDGPSEPSGPDSESSGPLTAEPDEQALESPDAASDDMPAAADPGLESGDPLSTTPVLPVPFEPPVSTVPRHTPGGERSRISPDRLALLLGLGSVALSILCLLPSVLLRFLPTVTGVAALYYGFLAVTASRLPPSRHRHILSAAGLAAGLAGIFAGPLWLNDAGDRWRHNRTSRAVTSNLTVIGDALNAFHDEQSRYPSGGTFVDSAEGLSVGMHGWMTDLLPYLGHSDIAGQINRDVPWSDPMNATPMQTRIDVFLTPGNPYELTTTGHAPAHFAGVGGHVSTEFGTGNLGVFGQNSRVTRDDVIDGLSQTMVAGEITQSLPAWGEPDNWRSTGTGLNHSPHGFGNAAGTGAHFLMADGSVRFLSNRVSHRTLQRLSTRNGSERDD